MKAKYESLYQINTRVWLTSLAEKLKEPAALDDIPESALDALKAQGFDWLYFLSVWQTGARGREISRRHPGWLKEFHETLPDLREEDIQGSGFAVKNYVTADALGGDEALKRLRERLQARGLKLMLDFVPNHTALDHPFVESHPEYYIEGTEEDINRAPQNFIRLKSGGRERIFAHGRDPYFDGWPDTLQLNYGSKDFQKAMRSEILRIAGQCDGLRCDMAMLILPDIFQRTWGLQADEFWSETIATVKKTYPDFCFMAEVYWDMEWRLQELGFDYTYDKRLYDRLRDREAQPVYLHLKAEPAYQNKMARFMENHDEPRAAAVFDLPCHKAAAAVTYLSPGLRFFHQGQFEGRQKRISPHLVRGPQETKNQELAAFYEKLLPIATSDLLKEGSFTLLEAQRAWSDNHTNSCFLAFTWQRQESRSLVVINYADHNSQCYLPLPFDNLSGADLQLTDLLSSACYRRAGNDLANQGLYLDMEPWQVQIFQFEKASAAANKVDKATGPADSNVFNNLSCS